MAKIKLCTNDLYKAVKDEVKTQYLKIPNDLSFEMYLDVPNELHEQFEDDAVLANKVFSDVSIEYKRAVKELVSLAKDIESQFSKGAIKMTRKDYAEKEWSRDAPDIIDAAQARMEVRARKAIQKWQSVRNDRKKYVIKSVAKVTVGTLGVAASALGIAVAATATGATVGAGLAALVAAIYGNVRAIVQLSKVIHRLRRDIAAAEEVLKEDLETLVESYKKNGKAAVASKELLKAAYDQFFAYTLPSISSTENILSDFKGKLDGLDIKLSEMGIKLNKLLDSQKELQKEIDRKLKKELDRMGYKSKKLPGLIKTQDELEKKMRGLLTETPEMMTKVSDYRDRYINDYKKTLDALKSKKPVWVDYAQIALKLPDLAIASGFTSFAAVEQVLVLVDTLGVEVNDVLLEKLL